MRSPQIKWLDGIVMSIFCVFTAMASITDFASGKDGMGLVLLGMSVVLGIVAAKNFRKKSRKM